jgi:photosystem II stability/assembly factor-like uncharacterized protein
MLNTDDGWAIGPGLVMQTTDGGVTWFNTTPTGMNNSDVSSARFFLNADNGWVLISGANPSSGKLYHSTDGGHSWYSTLVPFSGTSLFFINPSDGWALADLGAGMSHEAVAVFRTQDSGNTWKQVFIDDPSVSGSSDSLPFVGDKNGIVAMDGDRGWVTGAQPSSDFIYDYYSKDGGTSWSQQSIAMPAGFAGAMTNAFLPRFFDGSNGVLPVGLYADTSGIVFYLSSDGGITWNPSTPVVVSGGFSIASAVDFFVWDGGPSLSVSHDAGGTWSTISPNINIKDNLTLFQFVNATTGWAISADASSHYTLYDTKDGGRTWLPLIP